MLRKDTILIIQIRPLRQGPAHWLVVHRTLRICVPWWRAVAVGLRLVLGLEGGKPE